MNMKDIAAMAEMVANLLAQVDSLSAKLAAVTAERDAAVAQAMTVDQLERWYSGYCADCNGWSNARPEIRAIITGGGVNGE